MNKTKLLEKTVKAIAKAGYLEVTFRLDLKRIEEENITGEFIVNMFANTPEGKSVMTGAGEIVDMYHKMKREGKL